MTNGDASALTVKELVLRLDAKLDAYIVTHQAQHASDQMVDMQARGDPSATAAGRLIQAEMAEIRQDVTTLVTTVASHERTLQRMTGAMALVSLMGFSAIVLVGLRIAGVVP
jgi:hypothetical protein